MTTAVAEWGLNAGAEIAAPEIVVPLKVAESVYNNFGKILIGVAVVIILIGVLLFDHDSNRVPGVLMILLGGMVGYKGVLSSM